MLGPGETGELFVRGEQVSGRYTGIGSVLDDEGWFPTRDIAMLDDEGYLFIGGRSDDTIIRGGENIAPAELEDVLIEHPHRARGRGRAPRIPSGARRSSLSSYLPSPVPIPTRTNCASTSARTCAGHAPRTG